MTAYNSAIQTHLKACSVQSQRVFLPDYQIPDGDFPKVKRAIEGIGGQWTQQEQAYVFQSDPAELFNRICAGEAINLERTYRKKTQFFWTTAPVLKVMDELIFISRDMRVLEPSAGRGAIAQFLKDRYPNYSWDLDCCEMDPHNRSILEQEGFNLVGDDFLSMATPERGYHLIVANPPFSGGQDIQHFNHMYKMLAPGGRMVVVMSKGWTTSPDLSATAFRDDLSYFFHEVIDLPKGAFKQAGTAIEACVVRLDKPLDEAY